MSKQHSAIVTDGQWRKSVSAIRSLGKSNYHVTVCGDSIFTAGYWSRYTQKRIRVPAAADNPELFSDTLLDYLKTRDPEDTVILPMEDATLMWLSSHREEVGQYVSFLIPSHDALLIAQDKSATMKAAEDLKITIPRTYTFESEAAFVNAFDNLDLPGFVIKPCTGSGSSGILYDVKLDHQAAKKHWDAYGKMVIQERIPAKGEAIGVSLLMDRQGECIASFVHRRLMQYPISGGPSTDRESISYPSLVEDSVKLLKSLNWVGVAMVEWKVDTHSNLPKLMEINPRFWGSLELAVRAGVDFPALYADLSLNKTVRHQHDYKLGERCRWLIPGDILRYISSGKQRESILSFLKGLPGNAEEWDKNDISGSIANVICPFFLALNPKYWKYLRRR